MKSQPPGAAACLLRLFTPPHETEPILGDLLEEFGQREEDATHWYWRQALSAIPRLLALQFRAAPLRIAIGILAAMCIGSMEVIAMQFAVTAILNHFPIYYYIEPYGFWVFYSVVLNGVLTSFGLGWLIAWIAKRSEMAAVLSFSFVMEVLIVTSLLRLAQNPYHLPWTWFLRRALLFNMLMPLAVLAGGVLRRYRLTAPASAGSASGGV